MLRKFLIVLLPLLVIILVLWIYFASTYPTTLPVNSAQYFVKHFTHPHAKLQKETIGFLPYWRVSDAKYQRLDMLSEVNYFGLTVNKNGEFIMLTNNTETDPGWREWNSPDVKNLIAQTQIMGGKFSVTVIAQKNSVIENLLDTKSSQQTLIDNIIKQVKERHLNGVNIDFEYSGEAEEAYKQKFTSFAKDLSQQLHEQAPNTQLSLSILPLVARSQDIFDLGKLAPVFDRFIGMTYDYYGNASDIAGPIAPMTGFSENKFFFDVTTSVKDYTKFIPADKVVLGLPYYGWDWAVTDGKKIMSATYPSDDPKNYAAVMSYARMKENKDLKQNQCEWDDYAQETWCWYTKDGTDHQVWLEDKKSIGIKYDFANKQNLAGVAVWVLGYDKDLPDLWDLMKEKLSK